MLSTRFIVDKAFILSQNFFSQSFICIDFSMLQTWIKSRKTQVYARGQLTQWEIDYTLVPDIGLFKDYLEVGKGIFSY